MSPFLIVIVFVSSCTLQKESVNKAANEEIKYCDTTIDINNVNEFYLKRLFECGNTEDAFYVIRTHKDNFSIDESIGVGALLFDYGYIKEAISYLESSASQGSGEALYRLGYIYSISSDFKDIKKSLMYFEKAIKAGYYEAFYDLGYILLSEDQYKNIGLAKYYFEESIKEGNYMGYYGLGEVSLIEGDFDSAKKYFNLCLEKGYLFEGYNGMLKLYLYNENYNEHNVDKSKEYLDLILKMNNPQKYLIAYEFYKFDSKFKNIKLADHYKKLAQNYEDTVANHE